MSRFTPIEPEQAKKERRKRQEPVLAELNPVVAVSSLTGLTSGIIVHATGDGNGISAYGLLEGNELEISVRPRSQYHDDFEKQIVDDLKGRSGPVLLFQQPVPDLLEEILERSGVPVEQPCSLPANYLFDLVASYREGQASEMLEGHSAPYSPVKVRELVRLIKHAVACQLTVRSIRNLQAKLFTGEATVHQPGIDRYLALECQLPVSFDGTVIRVTLTGVEASAHLLAAGFLTGQKARVFFNHDLANGFHLLLEEQVNRSPSPFAAQSKRFVENWLKTEVDIELNQLPFRRGYLRFRNLFAGYNPGRADVVTERLERYFDVKVSRREREQARRDILFHALTGLILDSLLPFIDAENRWRVERKDLHLFASKKRSKQAIEKFMKRDNTGRKRGKKRKGIIDYTCRKPRGRLVKGSKLAGKMKVKGRAS